MKLLWIFLLASSTLASRHSHGRFHGHVKRADERQATPTTKDGVLYVPGPTVVVYELDGKPISEQDVQEGVANGTLRLNSNSQPERLPSGPVPVTPTPLNFEIPSAAPAPYKDPISRPQDQPNLEVPPKEPEALSPVPESTQPVQDPHDIDKEFPSGRLSCDAFPTGYGAIPVDHLGLGGWIGIQKPQSISAEGFFDRIETTPTHSCKGGQCCIPGSFCSYSCPPGYMKTSWPAKGGVPIYSNGEAFAPTLGGLFCNPRGELEMADGAISKSLCTYGTDKVTIRVQNKMSEPVSICQTDYPGTEGETIPTTVSPGNSSQLACPDQTKYYHHMGRKTSLQYYINNKGVAEKDACWWNQQGSAAGNWAPMNLGVSYDSDLGRAYISMFENTPTTNEKLNFAVEFVVDPPIPMKCKYSKGRWCSGEKYDDCNDNKCDVAFEKGTLTVVLTDD